MKPTPLLSIPLALLLSACGGGGSSASRSRVSNGGFEANREWTYDNASRRTDGGHTGAGYASLVPRRLGRVDGGAYDVAPAVLTQALSGLVAGRTYRITYWARCTTGAGQDIGVSLGDSWFPAPIPAVAQGWAQCAGTLTPSRPSDTLTFQSFYGLCIDDVEILPLP